MPVRLCPVPGRLYTVLLGYKESPVDEARHRFARLVRDLLLTFLVDHRACVRAALGGGVDLVLPVPSSSRPGGSPLERVDGLAERAVTALGACARWSPSVLRRTTEEIGHMRPNAGAFGVPRTSLASVGGARVLLLDDTYVSGSRAQSAAAALRLAGARTALIVPLGRVLRPDRFPTHADFLGRPPNEDGHRSRCVLVQTGAGSG